MEAELLQFLEEFRREFQKERRFPAREGHPAAGMLVKRNVFFNNVHDLGNGHLFTDLGKCSRGARIHAIEAKIAFVPIDVKEILSIQRPLWTKLDARAAVHAFFLVESDLLGRFLAFWVMAPHAG